MSARAVLRYVLRQSRPGRQRPAWWDLTELGLAAAGFVAYFLVRGAVVDHPTLAITHAREIVALQMSLGLWVEPRLQALAMEVHPLVRAMNFVYFWLDFPLIVAVGVALFWKRPTHYILLRDALLISGGMALVCYYAYPVAPPRYLRELGFVDTLEQFDHLSYQAQSMRPFVNPYAAVPSLHVGWAVLLSLTSFRVSSRLLLRSAGVVLVGLQAVAVVVTGNHFIFDGLVGLVLCIIAWQTAVVLQERGYPSVRWVAARYAHSRPRRSTIARSSG
ncbi:MAG: phosphatase PAP2 family protein [Dehalococcoidia bacterium]